MQQQQNSELFGLGPDRIESGVRQFIAVHAAANFKSTESELLYAMLHLLDGDIGMLQSEAAEAHESARVSGAQSGDLFILAGDNFDGEVAVGPVVVRGARLTAWISIPCASMWRRRASISFVGLRKGPSNVGGPPFGISASGWPWVKSCRST